MPEVDSTPSRGLGAIIPAAILEGFGVLFVIVAVALTAIDIGGRWFLQSPSSVAQDLTEQLVPIIAFMGVAVAFAAAATTIAWPPRDRAASPARYWSWLGPVVGLPVLIAVAAMFIARYIAAQDLKELSMTAALPLAPFFRFAAVAAGLAAGVAIVAAVRALMRLAPLAPKEPELDI